MPGSKLYTEAHLEVQEYSTHKEPAFSLPLSFLYVILSWPTENIFPRLQLPINSLPGIVIPGIYSISDLPSFRTSLSHDTYAFLMT